MMHRALVVNPSILDFSAYDFWLKPYGILRIAGLLRGHAEFHLFDYMDRPGARLLPRTFRSNGTEDEVKYANDAPALGRPSR